MISRTTHPNYDREANATVDGKPFHSTTVAEEQRREDERLAYVFHGRPRQQPFTRSHHRAASRMRAGTLSGSMSGDPRDLRGHREA